MKPMKKILIAILIFAVSLTPVFAVQKYKDVPDSYWAAQHIAEASELGIVYGYDGNVFSPKKNVNRQEAFVMLFRIMQQAGLAAIDNSTEEGQAMLTELETGYDADLAACGFSDNQSMRNAAAYGIEYGICSTSDFSGGAKNDASRELIAKWSCAALGYETAPLSVLPYKDAAAVDPACFTAVDALYRHGIMVGGTDGKFAPKTGIIRAEIAAIAVRMLRDVQSEFVPTVANSVVCEYGKVLGVTEGGFVSLQPESGADKLMFIDPYAVIYIDGNRAELSDLASLQYRTATFSCVTGGVNCVLVQTAPQVQRGTVFGEPVRQGDYYKINVQIESGALVTYIYTDDSLGRLPFDGSDIAFIADGVEILEVK